jgi:KaiC/GvpD/RAD55 family RecA-like ATPase
MSKTIQISVNWLAKLLPDGWPIKSSTLITGPGGSGKPLIGNAIIDAWLKEGGGVVLMSLQYPEKHFAYESFQRVVGNDLSSFEDQIVFVQFDPEAQKAGKVIKQSFSSNLVYPEQWDQTLDKASEILNKQEESPGILLFVSALNLLFFSPTYRSSIVDSIINTMKDSRFSTLFAASSKPHADLVNRIASKADNLVYTDKPGKEMSLYLKIERMKKVRFTDNRIHIPIPASELEATKNIAEHSRKRIIPEVSKI